MSAVIAAPAAAATNTERTGWFAVALPVTSAACSTCRVARELLRDAASAHAEPPVARAGANCSTEGSALSRNPRTFSPAALTAFCAYARVDSMASLAVSRALSARSAALWEKLVFVA